MTQQCVNCPGAEDHSTAQCPLVSAQSKIDAERESVVNAMCMTWRHDFGLDRKDDELGSCGMTDTERAALRRQMGQLYDHHISPLMHARILPVGVPEGLTDIERKAVVGLIELASHAFHVADNGEDAGGETISVPRCDMDDLGKALDTLDELPDDMPGYTLGPSGRAEWALRRFFGGTTIAGQESIAPTVKAEQVQCETCQDSGIVGHSDVCQECQDTWQPAPSLPTAGSADLTAVRCQCCATEYPQDSYDAGFIAGSGMCQVCDAAMPPKDLPAAEQSPTDKQSLTVAEQSAPGEVEEVERIGYAWINRYNDAVDHVAPFPPTDGGVSYGEPLMTVAQHNRIVAALSAQDDEYPPCDYCRRELVYHPWHGSGLFKGVESRHIHACDECRHLLPSAHVSVPRELLENCADYMMGSASARVRIWHDKLRALLNGGEA